jgi:hypothetical protein
MPGLAQLASLIFFAGIAFADPQTSSPDSGVVTLHMSTDLIEVPVLVLKPPFRSARGLVEKNFAVRLDGGPSFHPRYVHVEGSEPLSLGVLVDTETKAPEKLSIGLQAALQHWPSDLLKSTDRLSIYAFGCRLMRTTDDSSIGHGLSHEAIAKSLSTFQAAMAGGEACHRPTIEKVLDATIFETAKTSGWKVIIMIVNGERIVNAKALEKVQINAAAAGVTLFVVKYVNSSRLPVSLYSETEGLNVLCASLGGVTIHSSFDDLGAVTQMLIEDIRERYILSFQRPGKGRSGPHSMEVQTNVKGLTVRPSAASAPLRDKAEFTDNVGRGSYPDDRPQYGTSRPPE